MIHLVTDKSVLWHGYRCIQWHALLRVASAALDLGDRRPLELLISISTIKVHRLAAAWLHDHGCMALCGRLSHGHPVMLSCYASRSRRPLCTTDVLSLFAALGQLLLLQSHPSFCCRCRHERASARAKADPQPSGSNHRSRARSPSEGLSFIGLLGLDQAYYVCPQLYCVYRMRVASMPAAPSRAAHTCLEQDFFSHTGSTHISCLLGARPARGPLLAGTLLPAGPGSGLRKCNSHERAIARLRHAHQRVVLGVNNTIPHSLHHVHARTHAKSTYLGPNFSL